MDSIIIAAIIVVVAIITAAVIGLSKSRAQSGERKKSGGNDFSLIELDSQEKNKKNKKQNNKNDIPVFNRLQKFMDSNWIHKFEETQLTHPQYVQVAITDDLHAYCNESQKPENEFSNQNLAEAHLVFIKAIKAFIEAVLRETSFLRPESNSSVVNSKAEGYRISSNDYDARYDREVKIITNKAKGIINSYKRFVQVARNESVYR